MENNKLQAAFADVRPTDAARNKILDMVRQEQPVPKRGRRAVYRMAALAATLAIILTAALWPRENDSDILGNDNNESEFITAPGVLKVYGYDLTTGSSVLDMETRELEGEIVESLGLWFEGMSSLWGLPLKFCVEDDLLGDAKIAFQLRTNVGEFLGNGYSDKYKQPDEVQGDIRDAKLGAECEIENGEMIYWRLVGKKIAQWEPTIERDGGAYVDVVIRADDHIVGYAVVKITKVKDTFYGAARLACEYYPMVDGEFQEITEEYIDQQIANAKQKANKAE